MAIFSPTTPIYFFRGWEKSSKESIERKKSGCHPWKNGHCWWKNSHLTPKTLLRSSYWGQMPFLDASLHLYKRVCPSVGRSVRNRDPRTGPKRSIALSIHLLFLLIYFGKWLGAELLYQCRNSLHYWFSPRFEWWWLVILLLPQKLHKYCNISAYSQYDSKNFVLFAINI